MTIPSFIINLAYAQESLPCPDGTMSDPLIGCATVPAGIVNPESGLLDILLKFTSVIMAFIASLAVIVLIYGALRYAMNQGNGEEAGKAKKIILWSIIGLIGGLLARYGVEFILSAIS
jgi:hypothetical protein